MSAPEPPVTSAFVTNVVNAGLQAAMNAMSEASDSRFKELEQNVSQIHANQQDMGNKFGMQAAALQAAREEIVVAKNQFVQYQATEQQRLAESERIRQEATQVLQDMKRMKSEMEGERASASAGLPPGLTTHHQRSAASSSTYSNLTGSLPHEQRTEAILSGLGSNLTPETLMQRAQHALSTAGVPEDWHFELAPNVRNTAVFINFKEASGLRLASNKIRRAGITHEPRSRVWLDARRTKAENKPSRAIHRAYEGMADLLAMCQRDAIERPLEFNSIEKDMKRLALVTGPDKT